MFEEDDQIPQALTDEELKALELELELDCGDSDGESVDSATDDLAALKSTLQSALHESSHPAPAETNLLNQFESFQSYQTSHCDIDSTLNKFKALNHEVNFLQTSDALAPNDTGLPPLPTNTDNLQGQDAFDLAIMVAVRAAIGDTVSQIEQASVRALDRKREEELAQIVARQKEEQGKIDAETQNRLRQQHQQEEQLARRREEARATKEETDRRMRLEVERAESVADQEMVAAKAAHDEKRKRAALQRAEIAREEEKRWTMTSKALTFVQSRMRGLMGRKNATAMKERKVKDEADRISRGVYVLDDVLKAHARQSRFGLWKNITELDRRQRMSATVIQVKWRCMGAVKIVAALAVAKKKTRAATVLQSWARCRTAKRVAGLRRDEKERARQSKLAREEAKRKYEMEVRKREEEEAIQQEKERLEKELARQQAEQQAELQRRKEEMEEATRIIEARLFSESRSPPRKLTPSAVREKRRKTTVGLISDILSASSLRQTQQTRYLPSRPSSQGREQSSARQDTQGVDEDMLAGLGDLSALSTLTLNVEQISDASNIGRLGAVNIRSLFLNVNCLKSLESIKDLTKVERLSVKDNKLASLDGLKPLQSLVELLLDVNKLTSLKTLEGSCWFNLANLSANTNDIKHLPENLGDHLPSLCSLSLYQNSLSEIGANCFRNLPSLTSLDLGRNRLNDSDGIARCLQSVPTLRRLILSQNQFQRAPPIKLPLLQQLWLSGNKIESMANWGGQESDCGCFLPCLLELYLQENGMEGFGGEALLSFACPILEKVDLKLNGLKTPTEVARGLLGLTSLNWIDVQDNPVLQVRGNAEVLNTKLLQMLPGLEILNGSSVGGDAKWGAVAEGCCSKALLVMPGLLRGKRAVVEGGEGAAEVWAGLRGKDRRCCKCDEVVGGGACPRCGEVYRGGGGGGGVIALDWREVLGGQGAPRCLVEEGEVGYMNLCKKMNKEGAKGRVLWKKGLESGERSVRGKAMEAHVGLLQRQIRAVLEGGDAWYWEVVESQQSGGTSKGGGGGRVNSIIALASTMRMQCCARRFLGAKKVQLRRKEVARGKVGLRLQSIFRGRRARRRVRAFSGMDFAYEDDELGDILGDEEGEFDFNAFGLGGEGGNGGGGGGGGEEEWKPTKPTVEADAWRTPAATPVARERESSSRVEVASAEGREISSPFGGVRGAQGGGAREGGVQELDMMSMNLRKNGFDFLPPNRAGGAAAGAVVADDMEIASVSSMGLEDDAKSAISTARRSRREEKEDSIKKDWGFTGDSKVAAIMMKRAKRMNAGKANADKKKKLSDPNYRLRKLQRGGMG